MNKMIDKFRVHELFKYLKICIIDVSLEHIDDTDDKVEFVYKVKPTLGCSIIDYINALQYLDIMSDKIKSDNDFSASFCSSELLVVDDISEVRSQLYKYIDYIPEMMYCSNSNNLINTSGLKRLLKEFHNFESIVNNKDITYENSDISGDIIVKPKSGY